MNPTETDLAREAEEKAKEYINNTFTLFDNLEELKVKEAEFAKGYIKCAQSRAVEMEGLMERVKELEASCKRKDDIISDLTQPPNPYR